MSIYPVRLKEWFPKDDENYFGAKVMVKCSPYIVCGRRARYRDAWGHHSLPWGYGDVWCTKKCLNGRKKK